ncbi:MAG TPA: hypothetical protein VKH37_01700, partial [Ferruginibacter sp.]|nr:hypothetical protein [Ferruginibacter sp.]
MNDNIKFILSLGCTVPALVGIVCYNKIDKKIHPFIWMMLLDVTIETIMFLSGKYTVIANVAGLCLNLYMLIDLWLFLYFIHINNYLSRNIKIIFLSGALIVAGFNYCNEQSFFRTFYYLLCYVSAVMLMNSVNILSRQVLVIKESLLNNFWFWFSSFSILYNAFTLLIFAVYIFAMRDTPEGRAIGDIQHVVNFTCYIF